MRSGRKILSFSTREFGSSRQLLNILFAEVQSGKKTRAVTEPTFNKPKELNIIISKHKTTASIGRFFASISNSSQDEQKFIEDNNCERKENDLPENLLNVGKCLKALGEENKNRTPDKDFNPPIHDTTGGDQLSNDRIWMDPEAPLEQRVSRFINQPLGSINHLDIKLTSLDLIKACGKKNSFEGMKNAQDILDRLIEEKKLVNNSQETTALVIIPDRPFKMVMYGWANLCRTVTFAPQRMREVLDLMIQEADYDKKMNEKVISSRIGAHSSSDDSDDSIDDDCHNEMQYDPFVGLSCEPTVDIYNTLLQGLSQAATRSIQAAIEAEHALSKMKKMKRTRGWHTKPNTRSYSLVLNSYAKSRHATAGERAESVLRDMIERHEHEKLEYFEEYGVDFNTLNPESNNRNIVTPDVVAYTTVIQAHGNSDSSASAEKAWMLLDELIHSDNPALEPDSFSFACTINAFSKMADRKKSPKQRVEAAQRAEEILWMMVDKMEKNQHSDHLSGSIVPFNACLNAWAQSFTPESPHRAEDLLHRMLDPNLQAIIKIQPNIVSFNTCMQAWSKACKFKESAAPEKAEELLTLLVKLSKEDVGSPNINEKWSLRPDIQSYVTVMNAYALSQKEDSVIQTRRLLLDLIQEIRGRYLDSDGKGQMNAHPFTIVLKAAANINLIDYSSDDPEENAFGSLDTEDKVISEKDPYIIALKTYSELINDTYDLGASADHFTFSEMLVVVAKYTSAESIERRQRVEEVFQDACNAGQVSSLVIRAMQKSCPNNIVLADLLRMRGNNTVASIESVNIFPKQWTSRVPQEFRRVSSRNDHFRKQSKFYRTKKSKLKGVYGKKGMSGTKQNSNYKSKTRKSDDTN